MDLGGRLEGQFQSSGPQPRFGAFGLGGSAADVGHAMHTSWSTSIINTENLRREKGVIYDSLELIIGTLDSTRLRGQTSSRRAFHQHHPNTSSTSQDDGSLQGRSERLIHANTNGVDHSSPRLYPSTQFTDYPPPRTPTPPPPPPPHPKSQLNSPAPLYIPRPVLPDVSNLSEKERVRLQEQVLLPSQPPGEPSAAGPSASASAPLEENIYDADGVPGPSVPSPNATRERNDALAPSAPTLEEVDLATPVAAQSGVGVDKQELERQRLLNEASAPPEFPDDYQASRAREISVLANNEPSAPVLSDDDEYGAHYSYSNVAGPSSQGHGDGREPLPRYER